MIKLFLTVALVIVVILTIGIIWQRKHPLKAFKRYYPSRVMVLAGDQKDYDLWLRQHMGNPRSFVRAATIEQMRGYRGPIVCTQYFQELRNADTLEMLEYKSLIEVLE